MYSILNLHFGPLDRMCVTHRNQCVLILGQYKNKAVSFPLLVAWWWASLGIYLFTIHSVLLDYAVDQYMHGLNAGLLNNQCELQVC